MILAENELPLFERPAASTALKTLLYISKFLITASVLILVLGVTHYK